MSGICLAAFKKRGKIENGLDNVRRTSMAFVEPELLIDHHRGGAAVPAAAAACYVTNAHCKAHNTSFIIQKIQLNSIHHFHHPPF